MKYIAGWLCVTLAFVVFFFGTYDIGTRLGLAAVLSIAGIILLMLEGFIEGLRGRRR